MSEAAGGPQDAAPAARPAALGWLPQVIGIHLILAGYTVAQVLPVLVSSITAALRLDVNQAGLLAFADMGAATVGSLFSAWSVRHWKVAHIVRWGTAIMIAGNVASVFSPNFAVLFPLRLISGFGEGIMVAAGTAILARARVVERAFALAAAGQTVVGALGVAVFPMVTALWGWSSFFLAVAAFGVPALFAANVVPDAPPADTVTSRTGFSKAAWVAIIAMSLTYVGIGAVWANLGRLGERAALGLPAISYAISLATMTGPAGTILAAVIGNRVPRTLSLAVAATGLAGGALILDFAGSGLSFAAGAVIFMFGWALFAPYASAVAASVDRTGAAVVMANACAGGGFALGPLLVVPLVSQWGFGAAPILTIGLAALSYCLFFPLADRRAGAHAPAPSLPA